MEDNFKAVSAFHSEVAIAALDYAKEHKLDSEISYRLAETIYYSYYKDVVPIEELDKYRKHD